MKLKVGNTYKITKFAKEGDADYCRKLLMMGFVPGATFKVIRAAPLGDPVEIEIKGFSISLRKQEASIMELEVVD